MHCILIWVCFWEPIHFLVFWVSVTLIHLLRKKKIKNSRKRKRLTCASTHLCKDLFYYNGFVQRCLKVFTSISSSDFPLKSWFCFCTWLIYFVIGYENSKLTPIFNNSMKTSILSKFRLPIRSMIKPNTTIKLPKSTQAEIN